MLGARRPAGGIPDQRQLANRQVEPQTIGWQLLGINMDVGHAVHAVARRVHRLRSKAQLAAPIMGGIMTMVPSPAASLLLENSSGSRAAWNNRSWSLMNQ